jgi:Fe-S-cluster containining protein
MKDNKGIISQIPMEEQASVGDQQPAQPGQSMPAADLLQQLALQVERGSLFTHKALSENFARLGEVQVLLHGMISLLMEKGLISEADLHAAMTRSRQTLSERGLLAEPDIIMRVDKAEQSTPPKFVDCSARLHICHAVCCRLNFALSEPEIEAGKAKWDLGRPYFIRRDEDTYCTHNDRQTGGCRIYHDRPGVCRTYSCANDGRIWKDFEAMELNEEWIAEHLSDPSSPLARGIFMREPVT